MKPWYKIQQNDVACIISPSYVLNIKERNVEWLVKQYQLTPYMYPNITVPGNHSIYDSFIPLANTDEIRAMHFIDAMNNPKCKLVWVSRGGYGTIRLIRYIRNASVPKESKPFIGFSDVTLLHLFLQKKWQMPSIHFGMPGAKSLHNTLTSEYAINGLTSILFASVKEVSFSLNPVLNKVDDRIINGETSGGNMLTFSRSFGTEIQPVLKDKILVFEEVSEYHRKIDGMLAQLQLLEDFNKVSAVVFGEITAVPEECTEFCFIKILEDFALNSGVPVFSLAGKDKIGHGHDINRALPMGTEAQIICDNGICKMVVATGVDNNIFSNDL